MKKLKNLITPTYIFLHFTRRPVTRAAPAYIKKNMSEAVAGELMTVISRLMAAPSGLMTAPGHPAMVISKPMTIIATATATRNAADRTG